MATRTLIDGAVDLSAAASWGGTLPVDGDTAIIPRGSQHITTVTGLSGVNLAQFEVAFSGRIESTSGAGLAIDVDSTTASTAIITGSGATLKFRGGTTKKWEITKINSPGSIVTFSDIETEDLYLEAGTVVLDTDAVCDVFQMYGGSATLRANATAVTDGDVFSGTLTIQRGGTYDLHGPCTAIVDVTNGGTLTINSLGDGVNIVHKNGSFNGSLLQGRYIDKLEAPATIGGSSVTIGPRMRISATSRVTFSNVTAIGVEASLHPAF